MSGAAERCSAPGCRRVDIIVALRGPRGARVPVCSRCWFSMPESGDTPESCAAVDAWYDRLGAARPERRNWPPNEEIRIQTRDFIIRSIRDRTVKREAARPVNAPTVGEDSGQARADVGSGASGDPTSERSREGRAAGDAASRSIAAVS